MKRENFYRRDPGAALAGMAGMSLEERGVYNTIIDLLYLTWRPVEDSPAYIAGHCGCAVQKLNPLLRRLIDAGKLIRFEENGRSYISNGHFENERAAVKGASDTRSGRGGVGKKSASVEEKSPGVEKNPPTCDNEGEEKQPLTPLEKSREDESRHSVPNGTGAEAVAPPDRNKEAWDRATALLMSDDRSERSSRSFIGKLLAATGLQAGDLLPAVVSAEALGSPDKPAYLRRAAEGIAQRRGITPQALAPETRVATWDAGTWDQAVDGYRAGGLWSPPMGPTPDQPGCRAPESILSKHGYGRSAA